MRSAFVFAATICFFVELTLIGLANASAVMAVNALIITVFAVLVLGALVIVGAGLYVWQRERRTAKRISAKQ